MPRIKPAGQKILRSTVLVMMLTLLGKATGLFRDVIVASEFGTSGEVDAFLVASTIVSLLFVWLKNPFQVVFVPVFTEELQARGERPAWESASVLLNTSVLVLLFLAGLGWLLAPYLVALVTPGFTPELGEITIQLTRVLIVTLVFLGLSQLLSGFFRSYERFGWPGSVSTVDNVVVIAAILLLTPWMGIYGLALSAVLGAFSQAAVQLPVLWKNRSLYRFRIDLKNPTLRRMLWMSFPLLFAIGGSWVGKISDRIFASLLPGGSLAALQYGHQLTYSTFELFIASAATVLFPFFSKSAALGAYEELGRKLFKSLRVLFWMVVPLSVGLLLLGEPLVRLVFQRGAFDEDSVRLTNQAVLFYAIGLTGFSLSNVLSFAFYSVKKTKVPVALGLLRLAVKIGLSFVLIGRMAHAGLALAESISFLVKAVLLLVLLPKGLKGAHYRGLFRSFALTGVVSAAMATVLLFALPYIRDFLELSRSFGAGVLGLGTMVVLGAGTYLAGSLLLRPVEVQDLYRTIRAGMGRS